MAEEENVNNRLKALLMRRKWQIQELKIKRTPMKQGGEDAEKMRHRLVRKCEFPEREEAKAMVNFLSSPDCLEYLRLCGEELNSAAGTEGLQWAPIQAWYSEEDANSASARKGMLYQVLKVLGDDSEGEGPYVTQDGCTYEEEYTFFWDVDEPPEVPKGRSGVQYELDIKRREDEDGLGGLYDCILVKRVTKQRDVAPYNSHQEDGETQITAQMLGVSDDTGLENGKNVDEKIAAFAEENTLALEDGDGVVVDINKEKNNDCTTSVTIRNVIEEGVADKSVTDKKDKFSTTTRKTNQNQEKAGEAPEFGAGTIVTVTNEKTPGGRYNVTTETITAEKDLDSATVSQHTQFETQTVTSKQNVSTALDDAPTAGGGKTYRYTSRLNEFGLYDTEETVTTEACVAETQVSETENVFSLTTQTESQGQSGPVSLGEFCAGTIVRVTNTKTPGGLYNTSVEKTLACPGVPSGTDVNKTVFETQTVTTVRNAEAALDDAPTAGGGKTYRYTSRLNEFGLYDTEEAVTEEKPIADRQTVDSETQFAKTTRTTKSGQTAAGTLPDNFVVGTLATVTNERTESGLFTVTEETVTAKTGVDGKGVAAGEDFTATIFETQEGSLVKNAKTYSLYDADADGKRVPPSGGKVVRKNVRTNEDGTYDIEETQTTELAVPKANESSRSDAFQSVSRVLNRGASAATTAKEYYRQKLVDSGATDVPDVQDITIPAGTLISVENEKTPGGLYDTTVETTTYNTVDGAQESRSATCFQTVMRYTNRNVKEEEFSDEAEIRKKLYCQELYDNCLCKADWQEPDWENIAVPDKGFLVNYSYEKTDAGLYDETIEATKASTGECNAGVESEASYTSTAFEKSYTTVERNVGESSICSADAISVSGDIVKTSVRKNDFGLYDITTEKTDAVTVEDAQESKIVNAFQTVTTTSSRNVSKASHLGTLTVGELTRVTSTRNEYGQYDTEKVVTTATKDVSAMCNAEVDYYSSRTTSVTKNHALDNTNGWCAERLISSCTTYLECLSPTAEQKMKCLLKGHTYSQSYRENEDGTYDIEYTTTKHNYVERSKKTTRETAFNKVETVTNSGCEKAPDDARFVQDGSFFGIQTVEYTTTPSGLYDVTTTKDAFKTVPTYVEWQTGSLGEYVKRETCRNSVYCISPISYDSTTQKPVYDIEVRNGEIIETTATQNEAGLYDWTTVTRKEKPVPRSTVSVEDTARYTRTVSVDENQPIDAAEGAEKSTYPLVGLCAGVMTKKTVTKTKGNLRTIQTETTVPKKDVPTVKSYECTKFDYMCVNTTEGFSGSPDFSDPQYTGSHVKTQYTMRDDGLWDQQVTNIRELYAPDATVHEVVTGAYILHEKIDRNMAQSTAPTLPDVTGWTCTDLDKSNKLVDTTYTMNPGGSYDVKTTTRYPKKTQATLTFGTVERKRYSSTETLFIFENYTAADLEKEASNYQRGSARLNEFGLYDGSFSKEDVQEGSTGGDSPDGDDPEEFWNATVRSSISVVSMMNNVWKVTESWVDIQGTVETSRKKINDSLAKAQSANVSPLARNEKIFVVRAESPHWYKYESLLNSAEQNIGQAYTAADFPEPGSATQE